MNSLELRKKFFDFFIRHGHEKIASSSLIPAQDPTLLFTNAGMNQFKDLFLGKEHRSYKRAVTIQKCVRAGGKHNDLDNVGFTQRHLTFFEMMGNFSFGDYFKKEAIRYAWDFLTVDIKFPIADLYVTVHHSDDESFNIWHEEMGVPKHKIFRLGEDNFWQMGDVGPCGPCTEIFVDRGDGFGCGKKDCSPACGCDRFIEVWNNVFMQFEKKADGTQVALTQTGVDTGMGLERLAMLVQKRESVFDTDVFRPIFNEIERITGLTYSSSSFETKAAFNVLGDHIRSATMLISDGCAPSNEGRGYVLRKIIRRAALFSQKLTQKTIFPKLAVIVADTMKEVYPEIMQHKDRIVSVLESEVEKFSDNLVRGQKIMQEYIQKSTTKAISGEQAFALYDTYGFPLEVTELIAKTHGFVVDKDGFDAYMQEQKIRSGKKMKMTAAAFEIPETMRTEFTGYHSLREQSSVVGIVAQDALVSSVKKGTECWIIVEKTPFFVACGGQVNDQGTVDFGNASASILDLKKIDDAILIKIIAPDDIKIGDKATQQVLEYSRLHTMKNHTATHLLQAALQKHFGKQVKQAGSVVTPDYLRFDYTHHKPLTEDEITSIETLVNEKIWENIPVSVMH